MTLLATCRRPAAKRPRAVASWLAALWLGVVLQPCAMAFGGEPQANCPHCPENAAHESAGHGGHAGHEGHAAAAAGEAPAQAGHCGTPNADCYVLGDDSFDGRTGKLQVTDLPVDLPLAFLPAEVTALASPPPRQERLRCDTLPGTPPPAWVLYGVQLK